MRRVGLGSLGFTILANQSENSQLMHGAVAGGVLWLLSYMPTVGLLQFTNIAVWGGVHPLIATTPWPPADSA